MVALDLDGTLLTSDKKISPKNETSLKKITEEGIKVVLCTGRPINAIWKYIEQLGLTDSEDYTITFNGALVIQNPDRIPLAKKGIQKGQLGLLHDFCVNGGYPLDILDFEQVYPITDLTPSVYQKMLNANIEFTPQSFDQIPDQAYTKAVMATDADILDRVVTEITPVMDQQYHVVRSQPKILEFLDHDMDKSVGLKSLLSHYGWDFSNLMAFGDAENDAGMLQNAKVGVVMANGKPEIKRLGTDVTLSNDDDGVAAFIDNYF